MPSTACLECSAGQPARISIKGLTLDGMLDDTGEFRILQLLPSDKPGEMTAAFVHSQILPTSFSNFFKRLISLCRCDLPAARRRRPLPPSSSLKRAVRVGFTADAKLAGYNIRVTDSHIVMPGPYRRDESIVLMQQAMFIVTVEVAVANLGQIIESLNDFAGRLLAEMCTSAGGWAVPMLLMKPGQQVRRRTQQAQVTVRMSADFQILSCSWHATV